MQYLLSIFQRYSYYMDLNISLPPWPEVNYSSLPENTTAHGYTHQASARIILLGGKAHWYTRHASARISLLGGKAHGYTHQASARISLLGRTAYGYTHQASARISLLGGKAHGYTRQASTIPKQTVLFLEAQPLHMYLCMSSCLSVPVSNTKTTFTASLLRPYFILVFTHLHPTAYFLFTKFNIPHYICIFIINPITQVFNPISLILYLISHISYPIMHIPYPISLIIA